MARDREASVHDYRKGGWIGGVVVVSANAPPLFPLNDCGFVSAHPRWRGVIPDEPGDLRQSGQPYPARQAEWKQGCVMKRRFPIVHDAHAGPACAAEALEKRLTLSVSLDVADGVVSIIGDNAAQGVAILDQRVDTSTNARIAIDANGDGDYTDPGDVNFQDVGAIHTFNLQLKGGNDKVQFTIDGTYNNGVAKRLRIDTAQGDDEIRITGGFGNARLLDGSSLAVDVSAGAGNDQVSLVAPGLSEGSSLQARLDTGAGNDTGLVSFTNMDSILGQSNAQVTLNTGAGRDQVSANFGGDITQGSAVSVRTTLGSGNDTFQSNYDLESADIMGAASRLALNVQGQAGDDVLSLRALDFNMDMFAFNQGRFSVVFEGDAGNDRTDVLLGMTRLDGGTFRISTLGGPGDDSARVEVKTSAASQGGTVDITQRGDAGNDVLALTINDQAGNSTYGPRGFALVDGGAGFDSATVSGNGVVEVRRVEL